MNRLESIEAYIPSSVDLLSVEGAFLAYFVIFFAITFRYFLIVAPVYFLLGKPLYQESKRLRPKPGQEWYEIKMSLLSTFVFSFFSLIMAIGIQQGWTQMYFRFDQWPIWYFPLSFLIYSVIHEIYFYFTHVWMHHPRLFDLMHAVHHRSNPVSPWASFSFHPLETVVHAVFIPLMVFVIPIHPITLIAYLTLMTITAVSNHLGRELISWSWLRQQFISGRHHQLHHQKYKGNYGLYFCAMDRWMGTEIYDPQGDYKKVLSEVSV